MVYTLSIDKPRRGQYRAVISAPGRTVCQCTGKDIGTVLRKCTGVPVFDAPHLLVWYEHVCAGTVDVAEIRSLPDSLADMLHSLHGNGPAAARI